MIEKTAVDMFYLFNLAAPVLTGRRCQVRARTPFREGAAGVCIYTKTGVVIDVDPGLIYSALDLTQGLRDMYTVFLHECAHAKLHYSPNASGDLLAKLPPARSGVIDPSVPGNKAHETDADLLAFAWNFKAEQNKADADMWWKPRGLLVGITRRPETERLAVLASPALAMQSIKSILKKGRSR